MTGRHWILEETIKLCMIAYVIESDCWYTSNIDSRFTSPEALMMRRHQNLMFGISDSRRRAVTVEGFLVHDSRHDIVSFESS